MKRKTGRSRRSLHGSILAILLLFAVTATIAFPGPWNQAVGAINAERLQIQDDGFNLGLDLQGGAHLVYEADMSAVPPNDRASALEGIRGVIERRVNVFGVSEPVVQTNITGDHFRIIVELAGVFDIEEAIASIGETPILEFKVPLKDVQLEPTEEEEAEVEAAQEEERERALEVLDRALDGEDFSLLAREFSIDEETKEDGGYLGFIEEDMPVFGELATRIKNDRLRVGVINGLYEAASTLHVVKLLSIEQRQELLLSHIIICHQESERCESDRTKIEAELMIEELAGEVTRNNFAEKAREFSEDGTAAEGGDLGWVRDGQMVEAFEDAASALRDNRVSGIIETEFGYHLIHRRDSRTVPSYEIAHIQMPWTTLYDVVNLDPWENTELSGSHVRGASVAFDPNTNIPYVVLDFDSEGGQLFGEITAAHVQEPIAIFLDGEAISTPMVQEPIYGGQASITGSFTIEEARTLAQRLNAGALPVPIELVTQQTVGPTLGQMSLERSIQAALIGFAFVALFMLLYYRLSGLIAIVSLVIYVAINLAAYKLFNVTLTLSGIAGFILSIGMAVDANILIFERLKEELTSGRDLSTAIDEGFRRAWTSIRDGNITTLIAAFILFTMSTSFIKGFALTLAIGILVSMFSAVFISRILLKWVSKIKPFKHVWLYKKTK